MTAQESADIVFGGLTPAEQSFFPRAHFDLTVSMGPVGIDAALENVPLEEWRNTIYGLWLSQWQPRGRVQQ